MLSRIRSMLVVCAHADDEVLGAGGMIAAAARRGVPVHVIVLSTSVLSRRLSPGDAERVRQRRRRDASAAAERLGASLEIHDLPDNGFGTVPATALHAVVEDAVSVHRPDLVVTHWAHDLSVDHQLTAQSVAVACRPVDGRVTPTLLSFEIRSSTDWVPGGSSPAFSPTVFVGLDDAAWAAKEAALECYADEMRAAPHARSLEGVDALARYRGTQVGLPRAEAFVLMRSVVVP